MTKTLKVILCFLPLILMLLLVTTIPVTKATIPIIFIGGIGATGGIILLSISFCYHMYVNRKNKRR